MSLDPPRTPTAVAIGALTLAFLVSVTGGLVGPSAVAQTPAASGGEQVRELVTSWYAKARRAAPGTWGIAIADQSGKLLWSEQADLPMIPASTVKLLTTGFARSVLGPSARRSTRVVGTGRLDPETGTWVGTWALEVNGDPTLERPQGQGPRLVELAEQLRANGIRRLTGPFRVVSADGPADAWYPEAWAPKHRSRLFAPKVGPLTIHENTVWFSIAPAARPGQRPVVSGASPRGIESLIDVRARTVAGRRARLAIQPAGNGGWVVTGTIGTRARARRFAQPASDPRAVLQAAWSRALADAGVVWAPSDAGMASLSGEVPKVIAEVESPPFDSVASEVNRRSLNYAAELLLQWAGGRYTGPDKLMEHVRQITGTRDGVHLVDGSGLSYEDRVSPNTFISYLAKFPTTSAGRNFPQLLPANGTGTLRRLNSGLPGEGVVRAKTGTLGMVSSVVGYLGRPDGVLLVSLIYNGPRVYTARQQQWKLFRMLGANGVIIPADSAGMGEEDRLGGD